MIIVNGRFLLQRITGVQRYARELLTELDKIVMPGEVEMAVPPEAKDIPVYRNIKVVKTGQFHNRVWEHISFPLYVKKRNGIPLSLCNVAPIPYPGIVCIHDVKIKVRPKDFSKKFLLWYNLLFSNACRRARKIITVSEFSKKEICKYYHVKPERIVVIPSAWQHYQKIKYDEGTLTKYKLKRNEYYFSMSSLEPNKNFKWIAETAKNNPDKIFAVAGTINKKVFAEGLGFECPLNMKFLGYVSDEEAKTLMRECKAFLFPTFYEGFGLPPLEAMSAGAKNIIVSDSEVMHEVFDDAVQYVDPHRAYGPLEIKENISQNEYKKVLSKFSWEKVSAPRLLKLIRAFN